MSPAQAAAKSAACRAARDLNAKALIVLTKYGDTARRMSKYRPVQAIVAAYDRYEQAGKKPAANSYKRKTK